MMTFYEWLKFIERFHVLRGGTLLIYSPKLTPEEIAARTHSLDIVYHEEAMD